MATYTQNRMQRLTKPLVQSLQDMSYAIATGSEFDDECTKGRYFLTSDGKQIDMSGVRIVHQGIDTVKQLYRGVPVARLVDEIEARYEAEIGAKVEYCGQLWILGSGGKSGYRYRLQNNHLGIIIFFLSTYVKPDLVMDKYIDVAAHLKIECSPHLLFERSPLDVQYLMDGIASQFLSNFEHSYCAIHLCVDVIGWQVPDYFEENFVTRSKRVMKHIGMGEFEFEGLGAVAVRYGKGDTFTYGSASGVQFTVYNKTKAAITQDKIDFWRNIWSHALDENFEPYYKQVKNEDGELEYPTVHRFELRYHHSVVKQFSDYSSAGKDSDGKDCSFRNNAFYSYIALVDGGHLQGLWSYGLTNFRLQYNTTTLDPMWCILLDDVKWCINYNTTPKNYKRQYKKPGSACGKNVALALGNFLALCARERMSANDVVKFLKADNRVYNQLVGYYSERGLNEVFMHDYIEKKLLERKLNGAWI